MRLPGWRHSCSIPHLDDNNCAETAICCTSASIFVTWTTAASAFRPASAVSFFAAATRSGAGRAVNPATSCIGNPYSFRYRLLLRGISLFNEHIGILALC